MRKIAEIKRDLASKVSEVRGLDRKETEAIQKGVDEINALMAELKQAEEVEKAAKEVAERQFGEMEKKAGRSFSFVKFFTEAAAGRGLTGLEAEVADLGAKEYDRVGLSRKGFVIPSCVMRSVSGNGKADLPADQQPATYVDGLRERLVVAQLGAHVLGDLVGNVPVVSSKAMTAGWGEEGEVASAAKVTFTKAILTPHRNYVVGSVSQDLLRQTSADVEDMIKNALLTAHAEAIEAAAINGTGSSGQPKGILNHSDINVVAGDTNGKAIDWKNVVELESKINASNANRGKLGYLTNAKVNAALKTTEKAAGTGKFILDGAQSVVNGYPLAWTNLVPSNLTKGSATTKCSAMIFGNFEDLYIGHWGGLDIIVDPYTKATSGEIQYVLNSYDDVQLAEPKSFAAIKDILA